MMMDKRMREAASLRGNRWQSAFVAVAMGMVAMPAFSQSMWQAVEPENRLCTAGFNQDYGWFSVDGLLGVHEAPGALDVGTCLFAASSVGMNLGGKVFPLNGDVVYSLPSTYNISAQLSEPALCEDYYGGTGELPNRWKLHVKDANNDSIFDAVNGIRGVDSLIYDLAASALAPSMVGAYGATPWLRCHSGLDPNFQPDPVEPSNPDRIHGDGFEDPVQQSSEANLQVQFYKDEAATIPLAGDVVEQTNAPGETARYLVRIKNIGTDIAHGVRVREFVPTNASLLATTAARVSCIDRGSAPTGGTPCATGNGVPFFKDIGNLAADAHYDFVFERRSNGTVGGAQALIQVAAFANPGTTTESVVADNSRALRINVVNNSAPTVDPMSVTTPEDTSVPVTLTGSDVELDPLTFSVVANPTSGSLSGTPPNLTYTPTQNFFGTDSFTYRAHDGTSYSSPATVSITVTPVDDAPVANQIGTQTFQEGDEVGFSLAAAFTDPEFDAFTLGVSGVNAVPGLSYNAPLQAIVGTLSSTSAGNYTITLTATQVSNPALVTNQSFQIVVTNVNQPPVVKNEAPDTLENDEQDVIGFSVAGWFDDYDEDDELTYSATTGNWVDDICVVDPGIGDLPNGLALNDESGAVTGTLGHTSANGSPYCVTVTADDNQNGVVSHMVIWTVHPKNAAPVIASTLPPRSGQVGQPLAIAYSSLLAGFSDPDGDALTLTVSGLPSGFTYVQGFDIVGVPAAAGGHTITVRATDPGGDWVEQTFQLTIAP